ncbi:monovalent cation/H+ antiporter subunit E [Natronomonas salina]|uniref:monovalent cation/H+ antiporter subunit E n=1 Tax=Natronomonas salina TaxID=1710540 RepID=UPI0015B5775E|nr:monovalent cation/H+ antiporter subunit E [Natronomonas salina]QLD88637.1 monovalent cation/H+ antiporter subunit E [Natronomonas salina]
MLVPVGESVSLRNTVAYAVETAIEGDDPAVHFVAPVAWDEYDGVSDPAREETEDLLERVDVWAREDAGDADLSVETAVIGADEYLFSPDDYARVIAEYADAHGLERVVVDPEYSPGGNVPLLRPMEVDLARRGLAVEEAPVETPVRAPRLERAGGALQFGALFGLSFLFYQLLGGFTILTGEAYDFYYELITGGFAAAVVAGALHRITLARRPGVRRWFGIAARLLLFVPYLLYEIVVANLQVTYIILHPKLPIEPRMTRVRAVVWGSSPITTLANSITLTPGTLTVKTEGQDLYVHSLFAGAREGLFDGGLERATRFLFYGRGSLPVASPEERDDAEVLQEGED